MLFSHVKISSFCANAHLVFHWCLYNNYTLYVDKTPHELVKSDFCEFIIHSGRLSVSAVLKSCFKTKFIRDMTRGWIEGQF